MAEKKLQEQKEKERQNKVGGCMLSLKTVDESLTICYITRNSFNFVMLIKKLVLLFAYVMFYLTFQNFNMTK